MRAPAVRATGNDWVKQAPERDYLIISLSRWQLPYRFRLKNRKCNANAEKYSTTKRFITIPTKYLRFVMNDSKKLFRPKYCLVPLAARTNPNIPAKAQIYLGELNILTNEYGYCWASDEQLAEMQGVSTRTILEWHRILEQEGFIKRDTVKKHVMNDERGKLDLKTERKIFVIDNPSNNFSEPQKTSCPRDVKKTSAPRDVKKTSGITIEPLTIENTTTEQVVVVVPSSPLDLLNLTQEDKLKILKEHDSKKISLLVERVKSWKGRSGDLIACNTILRD